MSQRQELRKQLKKLPEREMNKIVTAVADAVLDSSEQDALIRERIQKVETTLGKAGPFVATDIVMALGMFLDEAMAEGDDDRP